MDAKAGLATDPAAQQFRVLWRSGPFPYYARTPKDLGFGVVFTTD